MIFNNLKSFRREDTYLGSTYSNNVKDIERSLLFDTYNGYLKVLNKLESVFVANIEKVGSVIVKAETYYNWHGGDHAKKNHVFVKFSVMPHKSRLTLHKLVLRDSDFRRVMGVEIFSMLRNEIQLTQTYAGFFKYVRLEAKLIYSSLGVPMRLINHKSMYSKVLTLRNENSSEEFQPNDSYLKPIVSSKSIQCRLVTKINGKFAIAIVKKDAHTGLVCLNFYFPQFVRDYSTFVYTNSTRPFPDPRRHNMEKKLTTQIKNLHTSFGNVSKNHDLSRTFRNQTFLTGKPRVVEINDYKSYAARMNSMIEDESRVILNQSDRMLPNLLNNLGNQSFNNVDASFQNVTIADFNPEVTILSITHSEKFKHQLYWEILLKSIEVFKRSRNKMILSFGNTNNMLKEVVYSKELMADNQFLHFSVVAENHSSVPLIGKFKDEMFINVRGIYYFLKLKNYSQNVEKNSMLSLFKALDILKIKLSPEIPVNIYMLKNIAYKICKKMFDSLIVLQKKSNEKLDYSSLSLDSLLQQKETDVLHLHNRICGSLNIKESEGFLMIYKCNLIISPPVLLQMLLSVKSNTLLLLAYNMSHQELLRVVLTQDEILRIVPSFNQLLQLKLYLQLGERLVLAYKNTLLIRLRDSSFV